MPLHSFKSGFFCLFSLLTFGFTAAANDSDQIINNRVWKIAILGSSTAFGTGASQYDSSWVGRFTAYVKRKNINSQVLNFAVPGFTTYQNLRPDGYTPPIGRPTSVFNKNITAALNAQPDAIIINMPSNDASNNYSLAEQKANFEAALSLADAAHIPVWVTTTQPRNLMSEDQIELLEDMRDWINIRFAEKSIDFWTSIANSDGSISTSVAFDNVHVNNLGHRLFYNTVLAESILDTLSLRLSGTLNANAGTDQSITLPLNTTTLDGTASLSSGTITSYQWTQISGPPSVFIASPNAVSSNISNLLEGRYAFELTVNDDLGNIDKDTVNIIVSSRILIDFGPTITSAPDVNGNYWNTVTDGIPGLKLSNAITTNNVLTGLKLSIINRIDGTFNLSGSGANTGNVIGAVNDYVSSATTDFVFAHPSASNGQWKLSGLDPAVQYTVKFWGTRTVASAFDDRIIEIKRSDETVWQEYNARQNTNYNNAASFTFEGVTEMSFDIRVKTGSAFGHICIMDIYKTASSINSNPIAVAGNDQLVNLPTSSTSLDGNTSTDFDGTIVVYEWTKISGPSSCTITNPNDAVTTITDLVDGIYSFRLKVIDNSGGFDFDTVVVKVGQRILIDFGANSTTSPDAFGHYWNNVTNGRNGVKITDAINTINANTGIGLEIISRIDGTFNPANPGVNTGNTAGIVGDYPNSATTDYAFADTSARNGQWKLTGLDSTKEYRVKFWGTKSATFATFIEIKLAEETTWQSYNAALNTDFNRAAVFTLSGRTSATFDIRVQSLSFFGYICLMDIFTSRPSAVCLPASSDETVSACDSLIWNGTKYTASGNYSFTSTNAFGCDSVANLHLTINQPTSSEETVSACESYSWNGGTYNLSGDYTFTTSNAAGCDSVAILRLTIINPPSISAGPDQTIDPNSSATLNGSVSDPFSAVVWSGGNGTFTPDANTLNAVYTPSADEIAAGSVTLTLSTDGGICGTISSTMNISITGTTPVRLIQFTGNNKNQVNQLNWTTGMEQNNLGFDIEKSINGRDFVRIGYIASKAPNGNSQLPQDYVFDDNNLTTSLNYYRLKQKDINGSYRYSEVISIKTSGAPEQMVHIYPNPAGRQINLNLYSNEVKTIQLSIIDLAGRICIKRSVALVKGTNLNTLQVDQLLPGLYTIQLSTTDGIVFHTMRFVKQ